MNVRLENRTVGRITQLACEGASGELICTSDSVEVHVYLQRGRVAWATDAASPLAFTRYLLKTAQIDVEVFREILESCRRERRPLGETLIGWGVATREEIRDALRHQIEGALARLENCGPIETLFLKRAEQFSDYDGDLTFALDELLVKRPPRSATVAPRTELRQSGEPASPVLRLRTRIDGIAWAELRDSDEVLESFPEAPASRLPADLVKHTVLDGASLVALRSSTQTLAGVALTATRSLWCLVDNSMTIGVITATLDSFREEHAVWPDEPATGTGRLWTFGTNIGQAEDAMREFMNSAAELHGVFLTDPNDPKGTFGIGRMRVSSQALVALVERRSKGIGAGGGPRDSAPPAEADLEGLTSYRAMTQELEFLLFGAELVVDGRSRFVWLALDRNSSKGLGWGYLTSLARTLVRALRA